MIKKYDKTGSYLNDQILLLGIYLIFLKCIGVMPNKFVVSRNNIIGKKYYYNIDINLLFYFSSLSKKTSVRERYKYSFCI